MSIEVQCPHCGSVHHVNDRLAGRRVRCPHCDAHVEVVQLFEVSAADVAQEAIDGEQENAAPLTGSDALESPSPLVSGSGLDHAVTLAHSPGGGAMAMPGPPELPAHHDDLDDDDGLPIKLKPDEGELDMTPMVDVTFLLLIFFMITAAFSLQKSIESPRQQSDAPSLNQEEQDPEELDIITVQIDELGSFLVLAPDWERETPGKQNLILALREAMGDGNNPVKLVIEVHEMAELQSLVDCMDAGAICDYGEMQVTQVDGFE